MEILRLYAIRFVGLPFMRRDEDPPGGYDCARFVQELLASVGMDPPGDRTAQGLFDWFERRAEWNASGVGALAFYGTSVTRISHVAMMLDRYRIIEAVGGEPRATSNETAGTQSACIRIRLLKQRPDLVAVLKPRYATIGAA